MSCSHLDNDFPPPLLSVTFFFVKYVLKGVILALNIPKILEVRLTINLQLCWF